MLLILLITKHFLLLYISLYSQSTLFLAFDSLFLVEIIVFSI